MTTDRIEKHVTLKAPIDRVWRALIDAKQFGTWFEVAIEGDFVSGQTARGTITTPGAYEGRSFAIEIERIDRAAGQFSYRWHPFAVQPDVDYAAEPMTLVEFHVAETPAGTLLTIVESGFDRIPAARRDLAFRMNDGGWAEQAKRIAKYVDAA